MDVKSLGLVLSVILLVGAAYLKGSGKSIDIPYISNFDIRSIVPIGSRTVSVEFSDQGVVRGYGRAYGWANLSLPEKKCLGDGFCVSGNVSLLLNGNMKLPGSFEGKVLGIKGPVDADLSEKVNFTYGGEYPYEGDLEINSTGVILANGNYYNISYAEIRNFNGSVRWTDGEGVVIKGKASLVRLVGESETIIRGR